MSLNPCRKAVLSMCVLSAIASPVVGAQSAQSQESVSGETRGVIVPRAYLAPITIHGVRYEDPWKNAAASMSVVTKEDIAKKSGTDFAGLLSDVEGVDVRTGSGRSGEASVSIRGMDSSHTLILVDGVPQNGPSEGALSKNGYGGQAQSFIPPTSSIERIEVVKGPLSTKYGSDALGGVINIITKKVTDQWHGSITLDNTFETDSGRANTTRTSTTLSGPLVKDRVGLQLRGSYIHRGNSYTDSGLTIRGGGITPSALKNYTGGGKVTWTPSKKDTYFVDYEQGVVDQTGDASDANSGMRYDRQKLTFSAENKKSFGTWTTKAYYSATQLKGYTRNTIKDEHGNLRPLKFNDQNYVLEETLNVTKWKNHNATLGLRYWEEHLQDDQVRYTDGSSGKFTGKTWAGYVEDTWSLHPKWDFTYGVRYEHPDKFDDHISPRGYLVYKASPRWTIKGGVSTGFKVPTLIQTRDGLAMTSGGRGVENIDIYGNPNLKPETSTNKEIGFYYSTPKGLKANITYFNIDYRNKIGTLTDWDPITEGKKTIKRGRQHYINTDRARVQGIELGSVLPIREHLKLKLAYTYNMSKITEGEGKGKELSGTARHFVNAKLDWDVNQRLNLWLNMEYRSHAPRYYGANALNASNIKVMDAIGKYYDPYTVFSLGGQYKFNKNVTMAASINNLFNKDFDRYYDVAGTSYNAFVSTGKTTSGTYMSGRNYWLSFAYNF